jgi:phage baseplate assembly protein V
MRILDHDSAPYGSNNENQRQLNLIRNGTVIDRRNGPLGPQVRVAYTDRNIITDWTSIGQTGSAGAFHHYSCPDIGDNVTVLHWPTGIEQGLVIASNPTANNPTFTPNSIDSHAMAGSDGSWFEHEPNSGTTTMAGIAHLHIKAGEALCYFSNEMVQVSGAWTKEVGGSISINAGGQITVTAPMISLNGVTIDSGGNVHIPGSLIVDGNTTMNKEALAIPHCVNSDGSGGGT